MKKYLLLIILFLPFIVKAENIVAEDIKYYKTTTTLDDSAYSVLGNTTISYTEEITKEEYDTADINTRNSTIIETAYKKLSVNIIAESDYFRYRAKLHWKNIPSRRSYDIMGIGHYASVKLGVSPDFYQEYCNVDGNCYTDQTHYRKISSGGFSVVFYLPSGSLSSLDQTLVGVMIKTTANLTVTNQLAVADYAHAQKSVSFNDAKKHTMSFGGLHLDSSISSKYDEIPYAEATWSGSW